MTPFTTLASIVAPLIRDNIDTDTIIPSREMKSTGKTGLKDGLFAPWRYLNVDARTPNPDFVLNQPEFARAKILAGGINFGCGSSREHAVWALAEYGISCVIAESFAPIFRNNCVRNGVLPIVLPREAIPQISGKTISVDLAAQTAGSHPFEIDAEAKAMLLEGLDAIDLSLKHRDAIAAWQMADRKARPWVYLFPPHPKDGEGDHAQHGGGVKKLPAKTNISVLRAKALRRSMTPPELRLWAQLKERPKGLKFRKQHPAGPYILDFYCPAAKLCVEIDGLAHDMGNNPAHDFERDQYLLEHGIKTIRFAARIVKDDLDTIMQHILDEAMARLPLHHPADGPPPHSANGEEK
ncbi:MAG: 3-isopropylmalate dehydratase small subunit [Pseudomonadota bacterium]